MRKDMQAWGSNNQVTKINWQKAAFSTDIYVFNHKGWKEALVTSTRCYVSSKGFFGIKLHLHVPIFWKQFLVQLTHVIQQYENRWPSWPSNFLLKSSLTQKNNSSVTQQHVRICRNLRMDQLCPAVCWQCVKAPDQKRLKLMSHVYYKNIPLIPQMSHFHGKCVQGSTVVSSETLTTTLPAFTTFTFTFLFHIFSFF